MAAIYQWFDLYEEEYTTTLYPLEVQDALLLSVDFSGGYFASIDSDSLKMGTEMVAGTLLQLLLSAPEQIDSLKMGTELVTGTLIQLLLSAPEQIDSLDMYTELVAGTLETILITTYMPDRGILLDIDLVPGSCYMTSV